jgi:hypothetical protein
MKKKALVYVVALLFTLSPLGMSTFSVAEAQTTNCVITSFTSSAANNTIISGDNPVFSWSTIGCSYVTLSGGTSNPNLFRMANSSSTAGPITASMPFTLTGFGNGTTSTPSTIYISIINGSNVLTTPATNVGSNTARLNGLVLNTTDTFVAYFAYGKTPQLEKTTDYKYFSPAGNLPFNETIQVDPSTLYYYQAIVRVGQSIYKGSVGTFYSASAENTVQYVNTTSTTTTDNTTNNTTTTTNTNTTKNTSSSSGAGVNTGTAATVNLSITNPADMVSIGDTAEYTVTYTNNTNKKLTNAKLSIVFPQGFQIKQTTQGTILNAGTVTVDLGTLIPGQTGSVFIQTIIGSTTSLSDTLVTNGTLEYTLPTGAHDSAVAYVINHATRKNILAGFTLGSGFFPSTIFGWFMTVIIILIIILLARRIARSKNKNAGHGGHH